MEDSLDEKKEIKTHEDDVPKEKNDKITNEFVYDDYFDTRPEEEDFSDD